MYIGQTEVLHTAPDGDKSRVTAKDERWDALLDRREPGDPISSYFRVGAVNSPLGVTVDLPGHDMRQASGLMVSVPARCNGQPCSKTQGFGAGPGSTTGALSTLRPGEKSTFLSRDRGYECTITRSSDGTKYDFKARPLSAAAEQHNEVSAVRIEWDWGGPIRTPLPDMRLKIHLETPDDGTFDATVTLRPHDGLFDGDGNPIYEDKR